MKQDMGRMLLAILIVLSDFLAEAQNPQTEIRVVFPCKVVNVYLFEYAPFLPPVQMDSCGSGEFKALLTLNPDGTSLFNIKYYVPPPINVTLFVAGGTLYLGNSVPNRFDPHGLKNAHVFINDQRLTSAYTVYNGDGGLNVYVKVKPDGTVIPMENTGNPHLKSNDRIPAEVHHHNYFRNTSVPVVSDKFITGWMQAITDNDLADTCKIMVDYLKVFGRRIDGNMDSLNVTDYSLPFNTNIDGGLYNRYPFFPAGYDVHTPMPADTQSGILVFNPSDNRNKVWHWWNHTQASVPNVTIYSSYRLEARIRITGHALVQAGIDFRTVTNPVVTHELGVSGWYQQKAGQWDTVVFDTYQLPASLNLQNINTGSGQSKCYNATQTLTVAGGGTIFQVQNGGSVELIAGQRISCLPGTRVFSGGHLDGHIEPTGPWCNYGITMNMELLNVATISDSILSPRPVESEESIKVYPNPSSGSFVVEVPVPMIKKKADVHVLGINGTTILHEEIWFNDSKFYVLQNQSPGLYILRIVTDYNIFSWKLVKL